jgi:hypothetical protein
MRLAKRLPPEHVKKYPNCHSACNFDPLMGGIGVQN